MSEVITIKTEEEIQLMREAGKILAQVHETLAKEIHEGMSTLDVDKLGEEVIRSYGCEPNFKGLYGYPGSVCVSVNDEVVHGIPTADHILVNGDIVPCCLDVNGVINLGNIYNTNLEDVINSNRYRNMLNEFKNNKKCELLCQKCNYYDDYVPRKL